MLKVFSKKRRSSLVDFAESDSLPISLVQPYTEYL